MAAPAATTATREVTLTVTPEVTALLICILQHRHWSCIYQWWLPELA